MVLAHVVVAVGCTPGDPSAEQQAAPTITELTASTPDRPAEAGSPDNIETESTTASPTAIPMTQSDLRALTAALLAMDNEWGDNYVQLMGGSPDVTVFPHDLAAADLDGPIAAIIDSGADIVYLATAGYPCSLAVDGIRRAGSLIPIVVPSACIVPGFLNPDLKHDALYPLAGTYTANTAGPIAESVLGQAAIDHQGTDPNGLVDQSWIRTWLAVETLKVAAELPGGLTRTNIVLATWTYAGRHPNVEGPINVVWPSDLAQIERARLLKHDPDSKLWSLTDHVYQLDPDESSNQTD